MKRRTVVLATRELHPFVGGGIAPIVAATANSLSKDADVTLLTTAAHRERYEELSAEGPVYAPGVRVAFVEEPPPERGHYYSWLQAYSDRVYRELVQLFPDGGPDFIEFPDYLGEGFVTLQAKATADRRLRRSTIAVRLHTTTELVSVLNGHTGQGLETRAIHEMERYCLRRADRILWPGGDVFATYERFYGADALAPAVEIPDAFLVEGAHEPPPQEDGPLRMLYLGRFERRKGVQNLVRALKGMDFEDWRLTLLGGDTDTGPLGVSMRRQIEHMTSMDDRFEILKPVARADVGRVIAEHDAVVVPSLWECWPNVAREALLHSRPVIGTPVGGLVAFVRPGVSGWLARETTPDALRAVIEPLARDPAQVRRLAASDGPRQVLGELTDEVHIRSAYRRVIEDGAMAAAARPTGAASRPLVSVVVPYHRLEAYVEDTLASIAAQTYPRIETVVVNDGSLRDDDRILEEVCDRHGARLLTQLNRGLGAARNFGIQQARGRYVLPLDADDMIDPDFVESCVAALEADGELAYVGTWSRYVDARLDPIPGADPGYTPLGNWSDLTEDQNVAGSATALFRRHLFDLGVRYSEELTSYEDWLLFLQLRRAGHYGAIIPRPLLRYRIRANSMLRSTGIGGWDRLQGEVAALLAEGAMRWTSRNA